jgi:hypothetical protein
VLDEVELADEVEKFLGHRRRRQRLMKVATKMGVAGGPTARGDGVDDVVAAVAVDEQHSRGALKQRLRRRSRAVFGEDVGDVEAAVVVAAAEGPDEAVLRLAFLVTDDAQARLVGHDDGADEHDVAKQPPERFEDLGDAVQELVHRRPRDPDALTRERLLEAVDRCVVGALGDDDMGADRRNRVTLGTGASKARIGGIGSLWAPGPARRPARSPAEAH